MPLILSPGVHGSVKDEHNEPMGDYSVEVDTKIRQDRRFTPFYLHTTLGSHMITVSAPGKLCSKDLLGGGGVFCILCCPNGNFPMEARSHTVIVEVCFFFFFVDC